MLTAQTLLRKCLEKTERIAMHGLPTGSPPLLLFGSLMFARAIESHFWLLLIGLLLIFSLTALVRRTPVVKVLGWVYYASLALMAFAFCFVLDGLSQQMSHDVSKCPNGCYIEFQVEIFGHNRARCRVLETNGERIGCSSRLRLPGSRVWLPGGHYRIAGGFRPLDYSEDRELSLWVESSRQVSGVPKWSQALTKRQSLLKSKVQEELAPMTHGVVWALVSGRRDLLPASEKDLLSRAGLIHFIAISGLHIGLILGIWISLVRGLVATLPISRRLRRYLLLKGYAFACLLTLLLLIWWGAPSSALRSAGMWMFSLVGRASGLRCRGADGLGVSGTLLLLSEPLLSRDLGFQLSSAAVGGLLWVGSGSTGTLAGIGTSFRSSFSATLCTLPLVANGFGLAALVGGSLNFLALPLVVYCIVPLLVIMLMSWWAELPNSGYLYELLELSIATLRQVGELLGATSTSIDWKWGHLLLCGCVWLVLRWFRTRMSIVCMLCTAVALAVYGERKIDNLRLDALDVGQGDATLIRAPENYNVLFDTGGTLGQAWGEDGYHKAVLELRKLGVSHLNLVILSHSDPDHTGALESILQSFKVERLVMDYQPGKDPRLDRSIFKWCSLQLQCTLKLTSPMVWRRSEVQFILFPSNVVEDAQLTDNELSSSLLVGVGSHNALMTGDLPRWSELALLRRLDHQVDLLKLRVLL